MLFWVNRSIFGRGFCFENGSRSYHMASLHIPFPEGEKVILLRGSHISMGRLPDNTIQIQDRTVSAYHCELILDGDHYRVHDSGSTNGVAVDGRRVQDFHLRGECQILVGAIRCVFHPGLPMDAHPETVELLPVREEVQATRHENRQVKAHNAILRDQVSKMLQARADSASSMLDEIAAKYAELQLQLIAHREVIDELAERAAIIARDRENLQRAYNDAQAALTIARADAAKAMGRGELRAAPELVPVAMGELNCRPTIPMRRPKDMTPASERDTEKLRP